MSKVFEITSGKATSGFFKDLSKGFKKVIKMETFNELWRSGRAALDMVSAAAGVPLSQVRAQYRQVGVDPDQLDYNLQKSFDALEPGSMSPSELDEVLSLNEDASRIVLPTGLIVAGLVSVAILLYTRKGKRFGRRFRKPRFRRWRRR